jgi:hypothetical protein
VRFRVVAVRFRGGGCEVPGLGVRPAGPARPVPLSILIGRQTSRSLYRSLLLPCCQTPFRRLLVLCRQTSRSRSVSVVRPLVLFIVLSCSFLVRPLVVVSWFFVVRLVALDLYRLLLLPCRQTSRFLHRLLLLPCRQDVFSAGEPSGHVWSTGFCTFRARGRDLSPSCGLGQGPTFANREFTGSRAHPGRGGGSFWHQIPSAGRGVSFRHHVPMKVRVVVQVWCQ